MNKNKYTASLLKIRRDQSETYDRNLRSEVVAEINRINNERNAYQFQYKLGRNGLKVTRVVPSNYFDRKLYIADIGKTELGDALRRNNWSKETTAKGFGISARSIGRMAEKYNISIRKPKAAKPSAAARKNTTAARPAATRRKAAR